MGLAQGLTIVARRAIELQMPFMVEMHEALKGRPDVLEVQLDDIDQANFDQIVSAAARHAGIHPVCSSPGGPLHRHLEAQDEHRGEKRHLLNGTRREGGSPQQARWTEADAFAQLQRLTSVAETLRSFGRRLGFQYDAAGAPRPLQGS